MVRTKFRKIAKVGGAVAVVMAGVLALGRPWDPCFNLVYGARRGPMGCLVDDAGPDLASPWSVHVMVAGVGGDKSGADGMHGMDINNDGLLDWVSAWEEGSSIFVAIHPGYAGLDGEWPHVKVGTNPSAEDAMFADVDNDGWIDVVSGGEGERLNVHFSPTNLSDLLTAAEWTQISIVEAQNDYDYMQLAFADVDGDTIPEIISGGRDVGATDGLVGWWAPPVDPRSASGWTFTLITDVVWVMTLDAADYDGDNDIDVLISDRSGAGEGVRFMENDGTGTGWTSNVISVPSPGEVRMIGVGDVDGDTFDDVVDGASGNAGAGANVNNISYGDGSWTVWDTDVLGDPEGVGDYHAAAVCDLDGDTIADIVFSYSSADVPGESGVVWMRQAPLGVFTLGEISGDVGEKFDNVVCHDVDGDSDLDIVTSEQNDNLGMLWFENEVND